VIAELREGSKVLEDQLRLMDEKFLELRSKLDVTRTQFQEIIKRVNKENKDLRVKYSAANNGALLDHVRLDKQTLLQLNQQYGLETTQSMKYSSQQQQEEVEGIDTEGRAFNTRSVTIANPPTSSTSSKGNRKQTGSSLPRPASAFALTNPQDQRQQQPSPSLQRPSSAYPLQPVKNQHNNNHHNHGHGHHSDDEHHHRLTRAEKEARLRHVIQKIDRKSVMAKKSWSAERIINLLDG